MIKMMTVVTMITLVVIIAVPAIAYREMRTGYGSGPGNVEDIAAERGLGLTVEQREKINTLREAHLKDVKPLQDKLYVKSRELKELWLARTPDREAILASQKEVQALRSQLMDKLKTYRLDAWRLLTPEQQAKIRPYGPERRPVQMDGPGKRGNHEHGQGMRGPMPIPTGVVP